MSSVVIAGDTSGSVTIAAPAIAGTTVITLPATTGTLIASGGALGTPSSGTLTSCTGLPMTTGVTGTLPVANGGTGVTTSTGSGANVLGTSPTLTTPVINGFTGDTSVINIGSGQVYKDASGNVGIGTTSPVRTLDVVGNLRLGSSNGRFIEILNATSQASYISQEASAELRLNQETASADSKVTFRTQGLQRMVINSSGNVGIGTTSPATKLNLLTPSATAVALRAGNSVSYAEFQVDASGNSQLIAPGGVQIFNTNGAERMRIDSSGNVGIGTTAPANKLEVFGNGQRNTARASTTAGEVLIEAQVSDYWSTPTYTGTSLRQSGSTATGTYAGLSNANLGSLIFQNGSVGLIATNGGTPIVLATANAERMRIDSSGNVGIGTSSPGAKLDVVGDVNLTGSFYAKSNNYFGATNDAFSMQHYTNANWNYSNLNLWRNATNTSTPRFLGMPLDGDSAANTTIGGFNAIWGAYDSAPTTGSTSSGLNGKIVYGAYAGHQWYTNGTERMRIDSSGDVIIGGTTSTAAARLNVYQADSSQRVVHFENTRNISSDENLRLVLGTNCNNTSSYQFIVTTAGADKLYIYGNGNIVNTNNSYGALSDTKLKENIVDATPKLADLMQVRVRNYNLIGDSTKQIGVVAQELETIFPAMVDESPDCEQQPKTREVEVPAVKEVKDENGNITTEAVPATTRTEEYTEQVAIGTVTKSVKYSVFVPMLIKAMQEQQALIIQLQADVAALKR